MAEILNAAEMSPKKNTSGEGISSIEPVRLVLIEDERVMRELFEYRLTDDPYFKLVATLPDGSEALEVCRLLNAEILVTDLIMPGIAGLEVVRKIRTALPNLKILALTADERPEVLRELLVLGLHGCVAKSSSWKMVQHALHEISTGQTFICPESANILRQPTSNHTSLDDLSEREREILRKFSSGYPMKEISSSLGISVKTAYNHLTNLKNKLRIFEPAGLIHYAIVTGLIAIPKTRQQITNGS